MQVSSVIKIVKSLNDAGVQYLIVGGLAVNAHGFARLTVDVDLVIGLEKENIIKGLRTLISIGYQPSIPISVEEFANPEIRDAWRKDKGMLVLKMWSDEHKRTPIDIFVYEPFLLAEELKAAKWDWISDDVQAPFVSFKTLLAMKYDAKREKDLLDIAALEKLYRSNE